MVAPRRCREVACGGIVDIEIETGKAGVGFEPTNHGFAIRSLSPLGHPAGGWATLFAGVMAFKDRDVVAGSNRRRYDLIKP